MNIEQTKCDHCGKTHNTPNKLYALRGDDLVSVKLDATFCGDAVNYERTVEEVRAAEHRYPKRWGRHSFDFCNEDCLREFLINRKALKDRLLVEQQQQIAS